MRTRRSVIIYTYIFHYLSSYIYAYSKNPNNTDAFHRFMHWISSISYPISHSFLTPNILKFAHFLSDFHFLTLDSQVPNFRSFSCARNENTLRNLLEKATEMWDLWPDLALRLGCSSSTSFQFRMMKFFSKIKFVFSILIIDNISFLFPSKIKRNWKPLANCLVKK